MEISLKELIPPCWYEFWDDVLHYRYNIYRCSGGRYSLKTTVVCYAVINLMLTYPNICAVVFQKEGNLLRDGIYATYAKVINRLHLDNYFKFNYSPLRITYKPTGQYILFRGLDDPTKTKVISTPEDKMYFAIQHFEELDRFHGENDISTATASVQRGGSLFWTFQTYNPPQNRHNWVNESTRKGADGMKVYHTDYRMVPPEFLGGLNSPIYREIKRVRDRSELDYQWMYLGVATGNGGAVFKNIKEVSITPQMIKDFDNHFNGLDWGWEDPNVFVRWHYDMPSDLIYAVLELKGHRESYATVAKKILDYQVNGVGVNDVYTILDSARGGEMLNALKFEGLMCRNMYKGRSGQLSREYGIQWLATRKGICIDQKLTPFIYEEFTGYEYQRDPHDPDKFLSQPITFNDHSVDATRYAFSPHYQKYGDGVYS